MGGARRDSQDGRLVYAKWLSRQQWQSDARQQLRTAHEMSTSGALHDACVPQNENTVQGICDLVKVRMGEYT